MSVDIKGLSNKIGDEAIDRLKGMPKKIWDDLPTEGKKAVARATADHAELTLQKLGGKDVSRELDYLEVTINNWAWVAASQVYNALVELVEEVAGIIFRIVLGSVI